MKPRRPESNGTVDSNTVHELAEFSEKHFAFYPTATDKELAYYVMINAFTPIDKNYLFAEPVNPVFT